jgi:hypothetical protein
MMRPLYTKDQQGLAFNDVRRLDHKDHEGTKITMSLLERGFVQKLRVPRGHRFFVIIVIRP